MMTVALKLLTLVRADYAYFGEKDYQQLKIISEMTQEFFVPTQIIPCPIVREESGLAMSSRNSLLSAEAHDKAADLFRALTTAANCARAGAVLEAQDFRVEYVEERWSRRLAAVNLEGVRLIDNVPVAEIRTSAILGLT
jgi:pantoate--beta-alanine ligase